MFKRHYEGGTPDIGCVSIPMALVDARFPETSQKLRPPGCGGRSRGGLVAQPGGDLQTIRFDMLEGAGCSLWALGVLCVHGIALESASVEGGTLTPPTHPRPRKSRHHTRGQATTVPKGKPGPVAQAAPGAGGPRAVGGRAP